MGYGPFSLTENVYLSKFLKRLVYWIHILYTPVYVIIKYRSSWIQGKICKLLCHGPFFNFIFIMGVMALFQLQKMFSFRNFLKRLVYWIHILYTGVYVIIKYRSSWIQGKICQLS